MCLLCGYHIHLHDAYTMYTGMLREAVTVISIDIKTLNSINNIMKIYIVFIAPHQCALIYANKL